MGSFFRQRVRNSNIWNVKVRWCGDLIRMLPGHFILEVFLTCPTGRQTQNTLERLYFPSGLGTSLDPPGGA